MTEWTIVDGEDKGSIVLYALSTCVHCKVTKKMLNEMGVKYKYMFVDQLPEDEMHEVFEEMLKYNPGGSFPTTIIRDNTVIVGSRLKEIKEAILNE